MSTWELATYALSWVLLLALLVTTVAVLRELAYLKSQPGRRGVPTPPPNEDGPGTGAPLPDLDINPINGGEPFPLSARRAGSRTLLVFLSSMCDGCQLLTEALNRVADEYSTGLRVVSFIRGPAAAVRAFHDLFTIRSPVVWDDGDHITRSFSVHHAPFALLYDAHGRLVGRGVVLSSGDLEALLQGGAIQESDKDEQTEFQSTASNR